MGFVARLFGSSPKKLQQGRMSHLQAATREQTQRQLITMALRDTLKRNGLVANCLTAEGVAGGAAGRARGMHVQLVFRDWRPDLLAYVVALEHAFRATLRRLDPLSPTWMLGVTWRFEPRNPLSWPQLPAVRQNNPARIAPSVTETASSTTASLDTLLQSGDAAFQNRTSADFMPTLPMPSR